MKSFAVLKRLSHLLEWKVMNGTSESFYYRALDQRKTLSVDAAFFVVVWPVNVLTSSTVY